MTIYILLNMSIPFKYNVFQIIHVNSKKKKKKIE